MQNSVAPVFNGRVNAALKLGAEGRRPCKKPWSRPLSPHHEQHHAHTRPAPSARFRACRALGFRSRQHALSARLRSLRSEEHTSELQSLMRISYAVFCLKQKKHTTKL